MVKKKKNKTEYYVHYEPQIKCLNCGHVCLRRQLKKILVNDQKPILSILVCPVCFKEGYLLIGEKEVRRKKTIV